jgi:hypothetical protein
MSSRQIVYTALTALVVVVAYEHYKRSGAPKLRVAA